mmetsp:Transcript_26546/g.35508  ORF Transcript_26546/g.35508 Transcript_26546/m.35508 type:complete len:97 (+) Transcript_26546:312-602(+)
MYDVSKMTDDDLSKGSRFPVVYKLCFVTFYLLLLANLFMLVGVKSRHMRAIGLCFMSLFGCLNLAAIVTTAVFRFNKMGQLAALSLAPVKYDGGAL